MRDFALNAVGLGAAMIGIIGGSVLLLASIVTAFTIHWSFGFGVLAVPILGAGMIKAMDWAAGEL